MPKDRMDRRPEELEAPAGDYQRTSYRAALVERYGPRVAQRYLQRRAERGAAAGETSADVHDAAARGTDGASGPLPYLDQIQRSFGRYDVTQVKAHTDGAAAEGAAAMGAAAFASGDHVAFAGTPDLHTAAHEAAHVVQQRGGVQLKGGVGEEGDAYERHADRVADAVVSGRSAEGLLEQLAPSSGQAPANAPVQRLTYAVRHPDDTAEQYDEILADAAHLPPPLVRNAAGFLGAIAQAGDELHIVGHGNQADIGGMSPTQLAAHLLDDCQMPRTIRRIVLHSCESATPDPRVGEPTFGQTYAEQLHRALLDRMEPGPIQPDGEPEQVRRPHHAAVTGQLGQAYTDTAGHTRVFMENRNREGYVRARRQADLDHANNPAGLPAALQAIDDEYLHPEAESHRTFHGIERENLSYGMQQDLTTEFGDLEIVPEVVLGNAVRLEALSQHIDKTVKSWRDFHDREHRDDGEGKNQDFYVHRGS